jgi:hypothetical protein
VTGVLPPGAAGLRLKIFFRAKKGGLQVFKFSFVKKKGRGLQVLKFSFMLKNWVFGTWNLPKTGVLKQVLKPNVC